MALRRNIAGVLNNDVYTFRCADDYCYENTTGAVLEQYRPSTGSGVFGDITENPFDPVANNQPIPATVATLQNVLPVTPGTPEPGSDKKLNTGALILAGLAVVLYLGMNKKENNTEALVYAGGIGLLYYRMHVQDKLNAQTPVTE